MNSRTYTIIWIAAIIVSSCGLCSAIRDMQAAANQPQNHITIHRTYSDIDGREMAFPVVYVRERTAGGAMLERRYDGHVIARELPSGEWLIKVGGKEFRTRDKRESVTYFDLGQSPDNPGAIRS